MNKKNSKKGNDNITEKIIETFSNPERTNVISDYDGSYTGVPVDNCYRQPVQDADDL